MLKKLLVGMLALVVITAVGFSVYNANANGSATASAAAVSDTAGTALQPAGNGIHTGAQDGSGVQNAAGGGAIGQGAGATSAGANGSGANNAGGNGAGVNGAGGQGGGGRRNNAGSQAGTGAGTGAGQQTTQNGFQEWVTYTGTVSGYAAPNFSLVTGDGQTIAAQLGNLNYVNSLGLALVEGESVTVTGFLDPEGALAVGQITLASSGQTYTLRGEQGRPMWAGGGNH